MHGEETESRPNEPLEENTYMMAVASLVRDMQRVAQGKGEIGLRSTRMLSALALLFLTVFLQISTLLCIKQYVTPQSVINIRDVYDKYELTMYGNDTTHTTLTAHGNHRGIARYFRPENFNQLDDDTKTEVCNIPFSQLFFFELVLFIWALTCMAQFKSCLESFLSLVMMTKTVRSMDMAMVHTSEDAEEAEAMLLFARFSSIAKPVDPPADDAEAAAHIIVGMTSTVKAFLLICVYLPWVWTTGYILWLGCRWLAATNSYAELVLNAVALEFLLNLKELIYLAMVSERSKRDLQSTLCSPPWRKEQAGYWVFLNGLLWGYLAILWVWFYIFYFQAVLPDYKWDVADVCWPWLMDFPAI
jgi:hypothetical protein